MSRIILDCEQRSPAWFAARAGKLTASVAHVPGMSGRKKGSPSETRALLAFSLANERLTHAPVGDSFSNADTERGNALEAEALAAYEARTGYLLSPVGFVHLSDLPMGCSPDGAVLDGETFGGGVDVKCPKLNTFKKYMDDPAELVAEYEYQIAHTLLVTGAPWWDVCAYRADLAPALRLVIVRIVPAGPVPEGLSLPAVTLTKAVDLTAYKLVAEQFLREVDDLEAAMRQRAEAA